MKVKLQVSNIIGLYQMYHKIYIDDMCNMNTKTRNVSNIQDFYLDFSKLGDSMSLYFIEAYC